ncbi:hypothetical protein [Faecalibacterium prausnitzii]|uniref:hypothetical protein n=1 Tax=Faecalibacterium prausnitzii TaxID=853 RepID=UPI001F39B4F8|nr:hypothetical protein [Faecalibacterium prausnitzii]
MKNWKKLLACLLVGLMALTVFTACDASVGAPMSPKRSDAESKSVKALRDKFKMTYNVEMTYNEDLSEKAYYVAYWVAGTSPSCSVNKEKTELSRKNSVDNVAKTYLNQGYYASAFDSMGIGKGIGGGMAKDDFTPGFDIKPDPNSTSDIIFVLPKDGTYPEAMTTAAKGKTKLGVAYVVKDGVSYAVVLFG